MSGPLPVCRTCGRQTGTWWLSSDGPKEHDIAKHQARIARGNRIMAIGLFIVFLGVVLQGIAVGGKLIGWWDL